MEVGGLEVGGLEVGGLEVAGWSCDRLRGCRLRGCRLLEVAGFWLPALLLVVLVVRALVVTVLVPAGRLVVGWRVPGTLLVPDGAVPLVVGVWLRGAREVVTAPRAVVGARGCVSLRAGRRCGTACGGRWCSPGRRLVGQLGFLFGRDQVLHVLVGLVQGRLKLPGLQATAGCRTGPTRTSKRSSR